MLKDRTLDHVIQYVRYAYIFLTWFTVTNCHRGNYNPEDLCNNYTSQKAIKLHYKQLEKNETITIPVLLN